MVIEKAIVKSFNMTSKGAKLTLEVSPDDVGSINGIQLLMGDIVTVDLSPLQLNIHNVLDDER